MDEARMAFELGGQGLAVALGTAGVRRWMQGLWSGRPRLAKLAVVAAVAVVSSVAMTMATGSSLGSASGRGAIAFAVGIALRELIRREAPAVIDELAK